MEDPADGAATSDVYTKAKASRFQFKSKSDREHRSKRNRREEREDSSSRRHPSAEEDDRRRDHRESRRRHKRKHRTAHDDRHPTSTRDGEYYDPDHRHRESLFDNLDEAGAQAPAVDPNKAFRESLFDALADDEGAAYWEGVYGQPVHVYPDTKPGPDGKLERMTEEEYADYVRTKMWEKSHQHIVEEREAKERARQERKKQRQSYEDETAAYDEEGARIRRQMAESLRRGEERKRAKEAAAAWENYTKKWDSLKSAQHIENEEALKVHELIPWPVVSGQARNVSKDEIERFLRSSTTWKEQPSAVLKVERVRWHPDKMQQRFGHHLDSDTMKSVTAVFQVIDRLWHEQR
jgi:hypothetical protein